MFNWMIRTLGISLLLNLSCDARELSSRVPFDVYEASYPAYEKIIKDITRERHLRLLTTGQNMLIAREEPVLWAFWATDNRKMTLEEGKQLAKDVIQETLSRTQTNLIFTRALANLAELEPNKTIPSSTVPAQFGFRIAFWDAKVERPHFPYLAQILAKSDAVYFYFADPKTQALKQPPVRIALEELLHPKSPPMLNSAQLQLCHEVACEVCRGFMRAV